MRAIAIALALLSGCPAGAVVVAETCLESVALTPQAARIQQVHGRYTYAVRVRVRPHPEHRLLVLTWDGGPAGGGSSRRALEGDQAAITWTFPIRDQLAGHYVYVATVYDTRGKPVGQGRTETVLVGEDDGEVRAPGTDGR